jgi:hypothetical protein
MFRRFIARWGLSGHSAPREKRGSFFGEEEAGRVAE